MPECDGNQPGPDLRGPGQVGRGPARCGQLGSPHQALPVQVGRKNTFLVSLHLKALSLSAHGDHDEDSFQEHR